MITTVITAHGYKKHKLLPTYESARGKGPIIITLTGVTPAVTKQIKRDCCNATIVTNPTNYSNAQWINGISAVRTECTHLVHDGDIIGDRSAPYVNCVIIGEAKTLQGNLHYKELTTPRVTAEDVLRVHDRYGTNTLSPGRGIFPTQLLLDALRDFERYSNGSLIVNDSLVIGNDLHIWRYAAEKNYKFYALHHPIIFFDTEDSTTVIHHNTPFKSLTRLYDIYREYVGVSHQPTKTISYPLYGGGNLTQDSLAQFYSAIGEELHVFYDCPPVKLSTKDEFATAAWLTALNYSYNLGYDYMFYLEDDCWIKPGIKDSLQKLLLYTPGKLQYGTVTCWGGQSLGSRFMSRLGQQLPTALLEGSTYDRTAVYCNGALCLYDVPFHYALFANRSLDTITPFDLHTGYELVDIYRDNVLSVVADNPKIYSDCGDHHINQTVRASYKQSKDAIHKRPSLGS